MNKIALIIFIVPLLTGCFTVTKSFDASKFEIKVKKGPTGDILPRFANSDAQVNFEFDDLDCQIKIKKKKYNILSKKPVSAEFSAKSLTLEKREKKDSLYFKPKADELMLKFKDPLKAKKGKLQFFVKEVWIDKKENKIKVKANIKLYAMLSFGRRNDAALPNPRMMSGNVKTTVSDLTHRLDKQFSGKDLIKNCKDNLFWNGNSTINTAGGNSIAMTSNVRYENWTCDTPKIKKFQKTADVDYTVKLGSKDGKIVCAVDATNLRGVPSFFEDAIENWFKVELGKSFAFAPKGYQVEIYSISMEKVSQSSINIKTEFKMNNQINTVQKTNAARFP